MVSVRSSTDTCRISATRSSIGRRSRPRSPLSTLSTQLSDRSYSSANRLRVRPGRARHHATRRPISRRRSPLSSIDTVYVLPSSKNYLMLFGPLRAAQAIIRFVQLRAYWHALATPDRGTRNGTPPRFKWRSDTPRPKLPVETATRRTEIVQHPLSGRARCRVAHRNLTRDRCRARRPRRG
jgi:hypothetical protein